MVFLHYLHLNSGVARIFFTVTNDLTYDQRMQRICGSLAEAGHKVTLVGRKLPNSLPLHYQPFTQKRLNCNFRKGKLFYLEFNIKLFIYLFFKRMDAVCAIDLDTILPCLWVSQWKGIPRIYDAHELFCEMKEVSSRRGIYRVWKSIEKYAVPKFNYGYTVNHAIAHAFESMYQKKYEVIRSLPTPKKPGGKKRENSILYQGAVNEGRCFESLIPAMLHIDAELIICGDGNYMEKARKLVADLGLQEKIIFKGLVPPAELHGYTSVAMIGITLFESDSQSNYLSLANRFFDYIQAGTPQICVNYPLYREIQEQSPIGLMIDKPDVKSIHAAIQLLLNDTELWNRLHVNCVEMAATLNWEVEKKKLLEFYNGIFEKASSYHHS
jgi:glycosyltransferase involved in cell wall biosynthesis